MVGPDFYLLPTAREKVIAICTRKSGIWLMAVEVPASMESPILFRFFVATSGIFSQAKSLSAMTAMTSQDPLGYPLVIPYNYGKRRFIVDFPIDNLAIFHSQVSLPEGNMGNSKVSEHELRCSLCL